MLKSKPKKLKTMDMELAVSSYLNVRTNIIVPNVSWGLRIHECDLLVITPNGYAWEVEIKTSKADLIKDKEKRHGHNSRKIKYLYFAIPDYLLEHREHIPERAGIIVVDSKRLFELLSDNSSLSFKDIFYFMGKCCVTEKKPQAAPLLYKFSDAERFKVAMLGAMRIWGLKNKVRRLTEKNNA